MIKKLILLLVEHFLNKFYLFLIRHELQRTVVVTFINNNDSFMIMIIVVNNNKKSHSKI